MFVIACCTLLLSASALLAFRKGSKGVKILNYSILSIQSPVDQGLKRVIAVLSISGSGHLVLCCAVTCMFLSIF